MNSSLRDKILPTKVISMIPRIAPQVALPRAGRVVAMKA